MCGDKHIFLKNGSDLFLRDGLETGYRFEANFKFRFSARVFFARSAVRRANHFLCHSGLSPAGCPGLTSGGGGDADAAPAYLARSNPRKRSNHSPT
jgi:hypothetical protein